MSGLGMQELILPLTIALVLFDGSRLPEIGKGIGQAIRNFKKATAEPEEIDITLKKPVEEKKEKKKEEIKGDA